MITNMMCHFSLKTLTRARTGGNAAYFVLVTSEEDLKRAVGFCQNRNLPHYVLGEGSNVLASDHDFSGVVIKLGGRLTSIQISSADSEVKAGAGAPLMKLGFGLAHQGFTGYEYMAVIPGTVGGAVRINAGTTKYGEIKEHFLSARVLEPGRLEIVGYTCKDMRFGHRESAISNSRAIVVEARFRLLSQERLNMQSAMRNVRALLGLRRRRHPKNPRTFGSTFKNPPSGKAAGWYLEQVGMKGLWVGDAMVAEEHANWILNLGKAKSRDVKELIETGQRRVFEEFGVRLEREVVFLPEDMENWQ